MCVLLRHTIDTVGQRLKKKPQIQTAIAWIDIRIDMRCAFIWPKHKWYVLTMRRYHCLSLTRSPPSFSDGTNKNIDPYFYFYCHKTTIKMSNLLQHHSVLCTLMVFFLASATAVNSFWRAPQEKGLYPHERRWRSDSQTFACGFYSDFAMCSAMAM